MVCSLAFIVECHQALLVGFVVGTMTLGLIVVIGYGVVASATILLAVVDYGHLVSAIAYPFPFDSLFELLCRHGYIYLVRRFRLSSHHRFRHPQRKRVPRT